MIGVINANVGGGGDGGRESKAQLHRKRIVVTLRNRLTWESIRMHLIGAEDLCLQGYPCEDVDASWALKRRWRRAGAKGKTQQQEGNP